MWVLAVLLASCVGAVAVQQVKPAFCWHIITAPICGVQCDISNSSNYQIR